jgi:kinetochore protein NNF1
MVSKLGDKCRKEFDSIMENRNVVARLNELEALVGEATARKTQGEEPGVQYVALFSFGPSEATT